MGTPRIGQERPEIRFATPWMKSSATFSDVVQGCPLDSEAFLRLFLKSVLFLQHIDELQIIKRGSRPCRLPGTDNAIRPYPTVSFEG
jgi:hypothetical protein